MAVPLVLPGALFCILSQIFVANNFWVNWFSLATLLAGTVAIIVLMYRTPCPKCQRPLGTAAGKAAIPLWKFDVRCIQCGVSMDEPMGDPDNTNTRTCG